MKGMFDTDIWICLLFIMFIMVGVGEIESKLGRAANALEHTRQH